MAKGKKKSIVGAPKSKPAAPPKRPSTLNLNATPAAYELPIPKRVSVASNNDYEVEVEDARPPSHRFFDAPIKGHPENKDWEFFSDDEEQDNHPSQVVVVRGHVVGIEVDPEIVEAMDQTRKETENLCKCCHESNHTISESLKNDPRVQGAFIAKVLLIETFLRVPTAGWLLIQALENSLHTFMYSQWLLCTLFIAVFYVILIWGVVFSNLGRQHPCDNILLVVKAILEAQLCATATSLLERWMQLWRMSKTNDDAEDPASSDNLYAARKDRDTYFTYPIIVFNLVFYLAVIYIVEAIFFRFLRGNIKKDTMFWIAALTQVILCSLGIALLKLVHARRPFQEVDTTERLHILIGPRDWDYVQFLFPSVLAGGWAVWRLFSLREVLEGKKFDLHEREFVMVTLTFAN